MYPKFNPGPPPPFQSWVLRWVIAYQKHKNFPLSPLQAGATPLPSLFSVKRDEFHPEQTGNFMCLRVFYFFFVFFRFLWFEIN